VNDRTLRHNAVILASALAAGAAVFIGIRAFSQTQATVGYPDPPPPAWHFFADTSFFNTPVDHSKLDPNSKEIIKTLTSFGEPSTYSGAGTPGTTHDWGKPVYFSQPSDPLFTLHSDNNYTAVTREVEGLRIRIPDKALPGTNSDHNMWVVDQENDWVYGFTRVISKPAGGGTLEATRIYRKPLYGTGFHNLAEPPGAQGIRPEEIAAGRITHVFPMWVQCTSGHPVAPWENSASMGKTCSGVTNAPSFGNRIFLDLTATQINDLPIQDYQKTVLRGLSTYGAVIVANNGGGWSLEYESGLSRTAFGYPNPWPVSSVAIAHTLDSVGGWAANLRVAPPTPRPAS
jgi:hypothetical protein